MRIFYQNGICIQEGIKEVVLDPRSPTSSSVVSHAHLDHLTSGAIMTPQTVDIMRIRKERSEGVPLNYDQERKLSGFSITLKEAGHVLGSAMVRVGNVLYTGDLNPEGGLTCGKAKPENCDTLIIESTYGKPIFSFPPKKRIMSDLLSWVETEQAKGPVAIGAYQFGKAQEMIALMNQIDEHVVVAGKIAEIAEVYRKHGIPLSFRKFEDLSEKERREPNIYVLPRKMLEKPIGEEVGKLRSFGLKTCYVSGWCSLFDFRRSYELDAQFPLSDHGDFEDLMLFVSDCSPKKVYTCHGHSEALATEIEKRLGIKAEALTHR